MSGLISFPPRQPPPPRPEGGWEALIRKVMAEVTEADRAHRVEIGHRAVATRRAGTGPNRSQNSSHYNAILKKYGIGRHLYSRARTLVVQADQFPEFRPFVEWMETWGPRHAYTLMEYNRKESERRAWRAENPADPEVVIPKACHAIEEAARALEFIPDENLGSKDLRNRLVLARRNLSTASRRFDVRQQRRAR